MEYIIHIILKAHLVVLLIILISYVIEKRTEWKLFIHRFTYPKNLKAATGDADLHAALYFVVCLLTLLQNLYNLEIKPEGYSFWKWLLVMIPLVVVFQKTYYRLTKKDPGRADNDWG